MKVLNFLFLRTIIIRLNQKTRFALNVFPYENDLVLYQMKNLNIMNLLMLTDENKWQYIYIKDFNRFMCNKTKNKNTKHF